MKMKEIVNTFITGKELRESNPTAFRRLRSNFRIRIKESIKEGLPHMDINEIYKEVNLGSLKLTAVEENTNIEDFVLKLKFPTHCIITGIELDYDYNKKRQKGGADNAPSYDKIIPKKGYVEGNVRIVSFLGNKVMTSINDRKDCKLIFNHMVKFLQKELGEAK